MITLRQLRLFVRMDKWTNGQEFTDTCTNVILACYSLLHTFVISIQKRLITPGTFIAGVLI